MFLFVILLLLIIDALCLITLQLSSYSIAPIFWSLIWSYDINFSVILIEVGIFLNVLFSSLTSFGSVFTFLSLIYFVSSLIVINDIFDFLSLNQCQECMLLSYLLSIFYSIIFIHFSLYLQTHNQIFNLSLSIKTENLC